MKVKGHRHIQRQDLQENTATIEKWTKEPLCVSEKSQCCERLHFEECLCSIGVSEESLPFPQSLKNISAIVNKLLWSYRYLRYMYSTLLILHEFTHLFKLRETDHAHTF